MIAHSVRIVERVQSYTAGVTFWTLTLASVALVAAPRVLGEDPSKNFALTVHVAALAISGLVCAVLLRQTYFSKSLPLGERASELMAIPWGVTGIVLVGALNAMASEVASRARIAYASNGYLELQTIVCSAAILATFGHALSSDAHVRVDVLRERLSERVRARIDIVGHILLGLPFCVLVTAYSVRTCGNAWSQLEKSPQPGGLPLYALKTLVPVAFVLLALSIVREVLVRIRPTEVAELNAAAPRSSDHL